MTESVQCESFNYDPVYHGLSGLWMLNTDDKRLQNNKPKKVNKYWKEKTEKHIIQAEKIAKHLYENGETLKATITSKFCVDDILKTINFMTHIVYNFEGHNYVLYENDIGRRIGLVDNQGNVPIIIPKESKSKSKKRASKRSYLVYVDEEKIECDTQPEVAELLGMHVTHVCKRINAGGTFPTLKNVYIKVVENG